MDEKKICTCGNTDAPPYCENSHENALSISGDFSPIPKKVLLMTLPYGDSQTAAGEIASLKDSLEPHGYCVTTADANTREEFKRLYDAYFKALKEFVRDGKKEETFVIAPEVIREHMLTHIDDNDEEEHAGLVKSAVHAAYSSEVTDEHIMVLDFLLSKFFNMVAPLLVGYVKNERPEVLGLFVPAGGIAASMYGFQVIKECFPRVDTVMWGSVFTDYFKKDTPGFERFLSRTPYIDKILTDDAGTLFLELLQGRLPGGQRVFPKA